MSCTKRSACGWAPRRGSVSSATCQLTTTFATPPGVRHLGNLTRTCLYVCLPLPSPSLSLSVCVHAHVSPPSNRTRAHGVGQYHRLAGKEGAGRPAAGVLYVPPRYCRRPDALLRPQRCVPFPISYTLYPIPYTLYHIPYTLYPVPYTLYPIPYTLYPTPYTLYPIPYTLHPIPFTLDPIPYSLYPTPYTPYPIPYTLYLEP